jgi:hypothetical protein
VRPALNFGIQFWRSKGKYQQNKGKHGQEKGRKLRENIGKGYEK